MATASGRDADDVQHELEPRSALRGLAAYAAVLVGGLLLAIGWYGISGTSIVAKQVPYLASVTTRDVANAPPGGSAASSHGVGLAHAVELAAVLGRLPDSLTLVTVEGATFELGAPLSPAVTAAVPIAATHVMNELGDDVGLGHE